MKHLDSIIITFILFILAMGCLYFILPKEVMLAGQTLLYSFVVISIGLTVMFSLMMLRMSANQMEGIVLSGLNVAERYYQVKANSWDTDTKRLVIEVNGNVWERNSLMLLPTPQMMKQLPVQSTPMPQITMDMSYGQDWIDRFIFTKDRQFKTYHGKLDGTTGAGKTTLLIEILARMGIELDNLYIVDPKNIHKDKWPKKPFCDNITNALTAIQSFQERMVKERVNENFDLKNAPHVVLVVDEWDWIYEEFGREVVSALKKIFKVLGELKVHLFLLGQSPLATDTGLSGSSFKNFGRIIINNEAISFLNNGQFPYRGEVKDSLYQQATEMSSHGERFALVIPQGTGMPSVEKVPHLEKRSFTCLSSIDEMEWVVTESETQSELTTDIDILRSKQAELRYDKSGKVVVTSVAQALNISTGGNHWYRAVNAAKVWDSYKEQQ